MFTKSPLNVSKITSFAVVNTDWNDRKLFVNNHNVATRQVTQQAVSDSTWYKRHLIFVEYILISNWNCSRCSAELVTLKSLAILGSFASKWSLAQQIAQRCVFRSFAVLGVNGDCASGKKLALDAGGLWPECLDMWSPTPSTCRVTMATVSSHLDACHRSATETTTSVWRESPQQWARALWDHWRRCVANDTSG